MKLWSVNIPDIPEVQIKTEQKTPYELELEATTDLPDNQIKSVEWIELSNPGKSLKLTQTGKLKASLKTKSNPISYYGEYKYRCEVTNICGAKRQKTFKFTIKRIRKGGCFAGLKFYVMYLDTGNYTLQTTNKFTELNGLQVEGLGGHNCGSAIFKILANNKEVGLAYLDNAGSEDKYNTFDSVGITNEGATIADDSRISEIILTPELAEEINKESKISGNNKLQLSFVCAKPSGNCHKPIGTLVVFKDGKVIKNPQTKKPYFNPDGNFLDLEICKPDIIE